MSRKANLKKLQEPSKTRTTRSSKNSEISDFFAHPKPGDEEEREHPKRKPHKKLSHFLKSPNKSPSHLDNDFDVPSKATKKAPSADRPKKLPAKRKKQTTLKSAFLKSEENFSEIVAQHAIAEDFNPDDMQIALALSKSDAESRGILEKEEDGSNAKTDIRSQLQKYGFRTRGAESDYDISLLHAPKSKAKWANKFTALTLRNPERQQQKLEARIKEILSAPVAICPDEDRFVRRRIKSSLLKDFIPIRPVVNVMETESEISNLEDYYVEDLFEPSNIKAGYLLKDYRKIPGRDFSPERDDIAIESERAQRKRESEVLLANDVEMEPFENIEADKSMEIEDFGKDIQSQPMNMSPTKETPFDNVYIGESSHSEHVFQDSNVEDYEICTEMPPIDKHLNRPCLLENLGKNCDEIEDNSLKSPAVKKSRTSFLSTPQTLPERQICAPASPDLFGDSDTDDEMELNLNIGSSSEMDNEIELVERYSSDEVKTFGEGSCEVKENCTFAGIDLTQDDDLEELCSVAPLADHNDNVKSDQRSVHQSQISSASSDCELVRVEIPSENVSTGLNIVEFDEAMTSASFQSNLEFDLSASSQNLSKHKSFNTTQDDLRHFEDCVLLSDDEVNYSIRRSVYKPAERSSHIDLTLTSSDSEDDENGENANNVSIMDLLEEVKNHVEMNFTVHEALDSIAADCPDDISTQKTPRKTPRKSVRKSLSVSFESNLRASTSPNDTFDLSRLRAAYGVSPTPKPQSENYLKPTPRTSFRQSRSSGKYDQIGKANSKERIDSENALSDYDDFDQICFGSPEKNAYKVPEGLSQLLHGEISIRYSPSPRKTGRSELSMENLFSPNNVSIRYSPSPQKTADSISSPTNNVRYSPQNLAYNLPASSSKMQTEPIELEYNNKVFLIRTENVPEKPNFDRMDSPTRLKQLHKYGIKPLNRKQAIIMLEYIYNQTHPFVVDNSTSPESVSQSTTQTQHNTLLQEEPSKGNRFNLKDSFAAVQLMLSEDGLTPEVPNENYIFQTNTSKKISTALLPLHIAWYNLIKSHRGLHEAVLYYEPIDLQEVYLFLKGLGYRYDPKEMKKFFDQRCIIFQYDLSDSRNHNGNIRKTKKTLSQRK